jgi:WD40 repeat protein
VIVTRSTLTHSLHFLRHLHKRTACDHTLLHICVCADKTIKLWKMLERTRRPEGYNLRDEQGFIREVSSINSLTVPTLVPSELVVEASPRRVYANAHTYHINSVSVNSDQETFLSADDLRINLWHLDINNQSFSILSSMFMSVLSCIVGVLCQ